MKVTSPNYINQSYANQTAQPAKSKALKSDERQDLRSDAKTDRINLSATTRELQKISAASQTEPESRTKKVADLKAQVQANQYTVNADQVAEKMIGSFLDEQG